MIVVILLAFKVNSYQQQKPHTKKYKIFQYNRLIFNLNELLVIREL